MAQQVDKVVVVMKSMGQSAKGYIGLSVELSPVNGGWITLRCDGPIQSHSWPIDLVKGVYEVG